MRDKDSHDMYMIKTHMSLSYDLYHIHIMSFSSYNGFKLNSHLTCFPRGFIAQSVERRTGITEVMGSNPIGASEFFLGFICSCLSYFKTARITFTCSKSVIASPCLQSLGSFSWTDEREYCSY